MAIKPMMYSPGNQTGMQLLRDDMKSLKDRIEANKKRFKEIERLSGERQKGGASQISKGPDKTRGSLHD